MFTWTGQNQPGRHIQPLRGWREGPRRAHCPSADGERGPGELTAAAHALRCLLVGPRGRWGGEAYVHAHTCTHTQTCTQPMRVHMHRHGGEPARPPEEACGSCLEDPRSRPDGMSALPGSSQKRRNRGSGGFPRLGQDSRGLEGLGSWEGAVSRVPPTCLTWQRRLGAVHPRRAWQEPAGHGLSTSRRPRVCC